MVSNSYPRRNWKLSQRQAWQGDGSSMAGLAPQASDFNGMVVKSEITMMGKSVTLSLVSAKEFVAPEGYNEMKLPVMPGCPAPK